MPQRTAQLYTIVCSEACRSRRLDLLQVARGLCAHRPWALQLRAKGVPAEQALSWLRELRVMTSQHGVQLFCNDRADWAHLAGADGVHVGQDDLPVGEVRRHFPRLKVGVSTHGPEQMEAALATAPDYVALGPVFATASKPDHATPIGLSGLARAGRLARSLGVPLVAIGGITEETITEVCAHADHVALISALLPPAELLATGHGAPELEDWFAQRLGRLFGPSATI